MDPTDENVHYIRVSKERECKIQVQFNSTILLFYALNIGSKFWYHFKAIVFFFFKLSSAVQIYFQRTTLQ